MSLMSSFKRLGGQLMLGPRGELGFVTEQQTFQLDNELTRAFATYTVHYLREYLADTDNHMYRVALVYHSKQHHPWGSETMRLTDHAVRMIYPVSAIGSKELTSFQKKKRENSVHYGTELLLSFSLKDTPGVPIFIPVLYDRQTSLMNYENLTSTTVLPTEPLETPVLEVLNLVGPAMTARKNLDVFAALKKRLEDTLIKHDARRPVEMKIMESSQASSPAIPGLAPGATQPESWKLTPSFTSTTTTQTGTTTALSGSALATNSGSKQWYNPALHDVTCEKLSRYLTQPRQFATVEEIRQLSRFGNLTMGQQKALATTCPLYLAPANTQLLDRGSNDQWNLYVLQGQVELVAADGEKKTVMGGTENARNAIAALKPRKFSVTTLSPVRFLWIHENIVAEVQKQQPGAKFELV